MSARAAAVIGVGLAGDNHVRALQALGLPIAGVLASRPERTKDAAGRWSVRAYADLDELLADPAASDVHVCTPPNSHDVIVDAILDAGRDVLCEKPLATSHAQALVLTERAAASPVLARVGFNRRFDTGVQSLRDALAAGELGEPVNVWGSYRQQWNAEPSSFDWRFDPKVIGPSRVVSEIGSHWFDLASHVLGSPLRRLSALVSDPRGPRDFHAGMGQGPQRMVPSNEDAFAALLEYDNGVSGSVFATQLWYGAWDDITLRVDGSKRSGWWDSRHPNQVGFADKARGTITLGVNSPGRSFEAMLEDFYGPTRGSIVATFDEARHVNATIDAVLAGGRRHGGWIEVERPTKQEDEA